MRILKVNDNFKSFFPVLGNVSNVYFPDVLKQLGVQTSYIDSFSEQLEQHGRVLISHIPLKIDGEDRVFSLMSTYTKIARPVACYRLDGLTEQGKDRKPISRAGRHVSINIPDRRHIREAIDELHRIQQELKRDNPEE